MLILVGLVLILLGLAFQFQDKIPFLGKLPGDISIKRENFSFYFPLTTSILLIIIISVGLYLFRKLGN